MNISLTQALRVSDSSVIAFIGAGGKTTAMFQLAGEFVSHMSVIVTSSSHLGAWQAPLADRHLIVEASAEIEDLKDSLQGIILVTGALAGDRTQPLDGASLNRLNQFCKSHSIPLLIEADGSRQKPLKAWAEHEPPIPDFVRVVVEVAGLSGLGKSLCEENVHRPELFSQLSGLGMDEMITTDALVRVLTHPEGGQKNIPSAARKVLFFNQADTPELQALTHGMVHKLLGAFESVIVSSLAQKSIFAVHEPVAGIILAAGESKRLGKPKQLLDWKGQPFIRAVAKTALEAGLSPVIVVTGANQEQAEKAIEGLDVVVVRNNEWQNGQASSIRAGVRELSKRRNTGAGIFLLVDQPQVDTSILRALVEKHAEGLCPVVAPMVLDRRANPVLFDRVTFPDLMTLEGDVGGRAIMHKHRVEYLPWHDDRLLLDVDTEEQYQRLIADETL